MKTGVFVLAAALALSAPVAAQADTVPVQSLAPPFEAGNSTVVKTPDGVHFGTYADASAVGGSLVYHGLDGQPLSALTSFGYTFTYRERGNTAGAAPYMRVFLDEDPAVDSDGDGNPANDVDHDVILDPSLCGTAVPPQATDVTFATDTFTVRFDDDACGTNPQQPFAVVRAANGGLTISSILVTQGFSTGQDVSALVRNITVNADTFAFNAPPAAAPGTTTIIQVPGPAGAQPATAVGGVQARRTCRGATVRRIHAPQRKGERFLRVNAALQSPSGLRPLRSRGRTITVDLRNRPEANYNVRLISRYRTKSGKTRRVVTRRNLSVACA
jgi:hypothetical protein